MSEHVKDLRSALFRAMEDVREGKLDLEKAKVINSIGQTIINSAKAEVDFINATGYTKASTGFLQNENVLNSGRLPEGITKITEHKIK